MKFFQQVERNVRLVFEQRVADDAEVIIDADGMNFVADLFQCRDDVPFSFERRDLFRRKIVDRFRRHEIFVTKNNHAQLLEGLAVFSCS